MTWDVLVIAFFVWQAAGFLTLITLAFAFNVEFISNCPNCDFFMPTYIYKHCRVNYFGTLMLCLFVNSICPAWSFVFWFYKLCTVGRK